MGTDAIAKTSARSPYEAIEPLGKNIDLMSPEDILAYVALALGNIGSQLNDYKTAVEDKQKKATALRELLGEVREMSKDGQPLTAYDKERYDAFMNKLASVKGGDEELEKAYDFLMNQYGGYTDAATGQTVGTLATDDGMTFGQVLVGGKAVNAAELKKMKPEEGLGEKDKDLKAKAASDPLSKKEDLGAPKAWDSQLPADNIPSPQTGIAQVQTPDSQDAHLSAEDLNKIAERFKASLENINSDNELTMMGLQQLMQQRNQISQFSSNMLNSVNEGLKSIIANWR